MIVVPPNITQRTRPEIATFVIDWIESKGICVPTNSRLGQMSTLLHSGIGSMDGSHPDYEVALECDRDLQLLALAFDQLSGVEVQPEFQKLLRKVVGDSVLPQHDRGNSQGRDAGFEIYVGGVCSAVQLLPIKFEEPDVTCHFDGLKFALAAKRIKNMKQALKRIKKGAKQIEASNLVGVVVLDLTLALNRENSRIKKVSDDSFHEFYWTHFKSKWHRINDRVQTAIRSESVLGIIVHDYHIRMRQEGPQLAGVTIRIPSESGALADRQMFERFSTTYVYGLPNQTDISQQYRS